MAGPHRRYNPLLDEWVLCSPQRLDRPWQGQLDTPTAEDNVAYDPHCYLCPGNARAEGLRNPRYATTFAFDNDFPALRHDEPLLRVEQGPTLVAAGAAGSCRVVCFSPRHDLTLAKMDLRGIRSVVEAWIGESAELGKRPDVLYVQVFENKGTLMGASNPHPHGQIWATSFLPHLPQRKQAAQAAYLRAHGRDLLGDYLEQELRTKDRLVCTNDEWVALVPFWAVWPFETIVLPRRRASDLEGLDGEQRAALVDVLRRLNVRYDNLFRTSFPYSMGFQPCPSDDEDHRYWRLHAVYFPPLLRSASIRKFLVGFELTCEPQRDLTAEEAAARLREAGERHWSDM
jgi:UDPglucose--hexose-1-phosphate uridylyltransferase